MNWRRCLRVVSVTVVLAVLVLVLAPVEVFTTHTAVVANAPLGAGLNTLSTFTLAVSSVVGGNKDIEQVDLAVDAQWTASATGSQPTPPAGWSVNVVGNTITWSGSTIPDGGSQDFNWGATTAASVEYSSHSWVTTDTGAKTNVGTVETAVSDWDSYKDADCTLQLDTFIDYNTENTIHMKGAGFAASTAYRVIFWDQVDTTWYIRDSVDVSSTAGGVLGVAGTNPVAYTLVPGTDTDGTWYATVYNDQAYTPATHDPNDTKLVVDDSFSVQESAIPEFPAVIAAIAVAGSCFGIYYWMRKRKLAHVKA